MEESLILVSVLIVATSVAAFAFFLGDRRRRRASGQEGPRPVSSIGEALRLAAKREGHVLVLFLGEDASSMELGAALAEDADVLEALSDDDLLHVRIRASGEDADVARALFLKYAQAETFPAPPVGLLLGHDGRPVSTGTGKELTPLGKWLHSRVGLPPPPPPLEA